jgi:hypothetical protein
MPAKDVKAYVKRNKNDAADAEAICEAVRAGLCIIGRDVAAHGVLATAGADHHPAFDDSRRHGDGERLVRIVKLGGAVRLPPVSTELVELFDLNHDFPAFTGTIVYLVERIHQLAELGAKLQREIVYLLAEGFDRLGIVVLIRRRHLLIEPAYFTVLLRLYLVTGDGLDHLLNLLFGRRSRSFLRLCQRHRSEGGYRNDKLQFHSGPLRIIGHKGDDSLSLDPFFDILEGLRHDYVRCIRNGETALKVRGLTADAAKDVARILGYFDPLRVDVISEKANTA